MTIRHSSARVMLGLDAYATSSSDDEVEKDDIANQPSSARAFVVSAAPKIDASALTLSAPDATTGEVRVVPIASTTTTPRSSVRVAARV